MRRLSLVSASIGYYVDEVVPDEQSSYHTIIPDSEEQMNCEYRIAASYLSKTVRPNAVVS